MLAIVQKIVVEGALKYAFWQKNTTAPFQLKIILETDYSDYLDS